jgi:hypothetical protein
MGHIRRPVEDDPSVAGVRPGAHADALGRERGGRGELGRDQRRHDQPEDRGGSHRPRSLRSRTTMSTRRASM